MLIDTETKQDAAVGRARIAIFQRKLKKKDWVGAAYLYKLIETDGTVSWCCVSGVSVPFSGPETYIFDSDENGKVTNFDERPGSFCGGIDRTKALRDAGYVVMGG